MHLEALDDTVGNSLIPYRRGYERIYAASYRGGQERKTNAIKNYRNPSPY